MFKTPQFWYNSYPLGRIISFTLLPISFFFIIFSRLIKAITTTHRIHGKTVICIGNVIAGGAGKTPVAISLCKEFRKTYSVCFISKGYGRTGSGFLKVDHSMNALITGDEPQLLQRYGQVYLYTNIQDILENIWQISEDVIIMDDGLQNYSIHKDCSILVIDGRLFGNGRIIPAGPLRESIKSVLKKSDFIISTGNKEVSILREVHYATKLISSNLKPQNVVAFSGIGDNSKFMNSLRDKGYNIIKFFDFPDHHIYSEQDFEKIQNFAQSCNAHIITTEKDFVKLSYNAKHNVYVLKLEIQLDQNLVKQIAGMINSVETYGKTV